MSLGTSVATQGQKQDSDEWKIPERKESKPENPNQIFGVDPIDQVIETWRNEILEEINAQADISEVIPKAILEITTDDKIDTGVLGNLMNITNTRLEVLESLSEKKKGHLNRKAKSQFRALVEILSILTDYKKELAKNTPPKTLETSFLIALIHDVLQKTLTKKIQTTELTRSHINRYTTILKRRFEELCGYPSSQDQEKGYASPASS